MTALWAISPSLEIGQRLVDLEDQRPPGFVFVNRKAFHERKRHVWDHYPWANEAERDLKLFNEAPIPVFKIRDPSFAPNYLETDVACLSARLREVLALPETAIRYRDAELNGSSQEARAQGYQMFHVMQYADPIDWTLTEGVLMELPAPGDSVRTVRRLAPATPANPSRRIYWRKDFTPPAPIFRVLATGWTMVTDELADRVMRAGMTDVMFVDRAHERAGAELVLRNC